MAADSSMREPDDRWCRQDVRPGKVYHCHIPSLGGVWRPSMDASCMCNEIAGLRHRMLKLVPEATEEGKGAVRKLINSWCKRSRSVEQLTPEQVAESYSGRLRKRYDQAALELRTDGECVIRDARISAFVKAEKYNGLAKAHKPRMIWGRTPKYNLELATYLKPIEHAVYRQLLTPKDALVPPTRMSAKGLNSFQRAALIQRKMSHFKDPRVFEVDMTAFEAHHGEWFLLEEHRFYRSFNKSRRLGTLLSWQVVNKGRTQNGVWFKKRGGRASGDFNTGLGNTVAMTAMSVLAARALIPGSRWDILADGDNALFFCEAGDLTKLSEGIPGVFLAFGHEAKVERPSGLLEQATFGQSRPVHTAGGWKMVREPFKVLSGMFTSHRHYGEMKGGRSILKSVAQCELVINAGVPILSVYAERALNALGDVGFAKHFDAENYDQQQVTRMARWQEKVNLPITDTCRESFARAWGVSVEEQVDIEGMLKVQFPVSWEGAVLETHMLARKLYPWTLGPEFDVCSS